MLIPKKKKKKQKRRISDPNLDILILSQNVHFNKGHGWSVCTFQVLEKCLNEVKRRCWSSTPVT